MDVSRPESRQRSARGVLDSLTLPRPSTSLTPLRPSAPSYRPQWSSSPPTSPGFGPPSTPDMRHSTRPAYRLPSFKATFGRMSFDPHLSDDEVPPSSDFGYNHSEYDYSDPGTPDDRLPSVPVDSPPPEDNPYGRPHRAHRLSVSSEHEEEAILGLLDLRTRPRVSSFASDRSAPDLVSTISPDTENEPSLFPMTPDRSSMDPVDHRQVKVEEVVIMDEDEPSKLTSPDSGPTDIGHIRPADLPPKLETVSEDLSFSDPPDEIHEDPWSPAHFGEEVVKAAASPISTPPAIGSGKVQEDDIPSLHTDIPDGCDGDPVATVPGIAPQSPVIPGPALSTPETPKRSTSRTRSRSRSPSLLSSPLTCLSSSPICEEETRQSTPESDFTDLETTCEPIKTSVKRRSIRVDIRASKRSRVETSSADSVVDIEVEEQPAPGPRRKNGKKSARSPSPSPCPKPSLVPIDVTAASNTADPEPTDQSLTGMVVEALAMTRASSMDVESIRKIVVETRPSLKTEHTKEQLKRILLEVLDSGAKAGFFGSVPSSGKDDSGKPLPPRYFYVPEKDIDQERATLLRNMMPRAAGRRSESMKYKQYYWKPLGKWSRWDAEDDL